MSRAVESSNDVVIRVPDNFGGISHCRGHPVQPVQSTSWLIISLIRLRVPLLQPHSHGFGTVRL